MTNSALVKLSLAGILMAATPADAQDGDVPNQTYQKSTYDSVNLTTGQVQIRNPLFSLPQKGRLKLSYSLPVNGIHYWTTAYNIYGVRFIQVEAVGGVGNWRDQLLRFTPASDNRGDAGSY